MLKSIRSLPLAFGLATVVAWSPGALAQNAPPPAASDTEDLEIPASPATVPGAAVPQPLPASAPAPKPPAAPQASPSAADAAALQRELTELRTRLEAVERARASDAPAKANEAKAPHDAALDKSAFSRPVPKGLFVGGFLQGQFESNQLSSDQLQTGGTPYNQDRFSLRRGRLRFDRGWQYANATLELEANNSRGVNIGIRRAEASLLYRGENGDAGENGENLLPLVMLTMGVTDIPFGFEILEGARARPFMERTLGSSALFPTEMDTGLKVSGAISFLRYAFALTNGEPVDNLNRFPRDPNAAKDFSGRVGVETQPLKALTISGGTSFYQGKGFHAGSDATKSSFTWLDTNEDRIIQQNELQAVPGTAATPSLDFKRWAYGLDLQLKLETKFGATRLLAEGFLASNMDRSYLIADPALGQNDIREAGAFVALLQDVTRWGQVGFRASYYDPNSDFIDNLRGRQVPTSLAVTTLSPMAALRWQDTARLSVQYDIVRDNLAKDSRGVPTDAKNNQITVRLQVGL